MVSRSVAARRGGFAATAALVASAFVLVTLTSPAEAKRRKRAPAYAPPYAAMVVDVKTGRTLHAKNEDELRYPASITKVMTLYLLFEQLDKGRYNLATKLRVTPHAAAQPPSKLGLASGAAISVEDAIKALVTKSANDVAATVGENIAGSEDAFADMMTRKARALGMSRTVFQNASGLPDPKQVTTARDLTVLARAVQERFPHHYHYFSTPVFHYGRAAMRNHNKLLGRIEGVDGIKTGYTRLSGFNLMTSARSDGHHIVAVVLGGRSGAGRDRIMASLVETNLPRAYAGARTAPMVAEAPAERPTLVAAVEAIARPLQLQTAAAAAPRQAPVSNVRPVVASATGSMSTTTPSAFRWITGAQAAGRAESRPAERAEVLVRPAAHAVETKVVEVRVLDPKAFERRGPPAETVVAKAEPKREETRAAMPASSGWVIQLGAPEDQSKAKELLAQAKASSRFLAKAAPFTEKVTKGGATLWRARFSGFDPDGAQAACKALKRSGFSCFATRG